METSARMAARAVVEHGADHVEAMDMARWRAGWVRQPPTAARAPLHPGWEPVSRVRPSVQATAPCPAASPPRRHTRASVGSDQTGALSTVDMTDQYTCFASLRLT